MKTPEEMAEEYASKIYQLKYYVDGRRKHSQGQEGLVWLAGKNGFLAGYKAGQEITEQEIADIIFDIRKREEDERKKLPIHKQQRHDRIWEKIKVKLIGIF